MSVLIDKNSKVLVQGVTGRDGSFHALKMRSYGTNIVGGTSPGKGGQNVEGIPVFNTVAEAVEKTGADTSIIFVPAPFAKDAMTFTFSVVANSAAQIRSPSFSLSGSSVQSITFPCLRSSITSSTVAN